MILGYFKNLRKKFQNQPNLSLEFEGLFKTQTRLEDSSCGAA